MSFGKLISSLLDDSKKFLLFARECSRKREDRLMLSYCRAVFFSAWSAMEGWINYISHSFTKTCNSLSGYEISFLLEKKVGVDDNGFIKILKTDEYHPTLKKLSFVFRRFGNNFDLKNSEPELWRRLKEIEAIRHSIVHPKDREHDIKLSLKEAENCYDTVFAVVSLLKEKIYGS